MTIYKTLMAWTKKQVEVIAALPPSDHPKHDAARVRWADSAERTLNAIRTKNDEALIAYGRRQRMKVAR